MSTIVFERFDGGIDLSRPGKIQDANRFRVLTNAFVTSGKTIRKRPGARYRWSWGPGVKGLFPSRGVLTGYWGDGNTDKNAVAVAGFNQDQGEFRTTKLQRGGGGANPNNTVARVFTSFRFGSADYVVAQMASGPRHFLATGAVANNDITDVNCPHGRHAIARASKVFAISDTGVVRYCKTNDATDWTTADDAGSLPTDRQTLGSSARFGLAEFETRLVVAYYDSLQLWNVDPDPALMSFEKRAVTGSSLTEGMANVGNDLFFVGPKGVRSLALNGQTGSEMELDVGTPVDSLVLSLRSAPYNTFARFMPSLGQWWLINGTRAMVYSFSRTAKVYAWSQYEFPWLIDGAADYAGKVYLRSWDGDIYELDENHPFDDDAGLAVLNGQTRNPPQWGNGAFPENGRRLVNMQFRTPFLDFKAPAFLKQMHGLDVVATRDGKRADPVNAPAYQLSVLYRSDTASEGYETTPIDLLDLPDDTRAAGWMPLGLIAPTVAFEVTHQAPERFELSALMVHFDNLGMA